ncbi:hypothetical protein [Flavobacterium sp.]|jgi:hypothetical protein|uniref:hypothetical protein n=1 Tax=Flavobacterium sp. TaxID=239 RepID=UPI0037BE245A
MSTNNYTKITVTELKELALLSSMSTINERYTDLYADNDENYILKKNNLGFMLKVANYNAEIVKKDGINLMFQIFLERYISKNYSETKGYYWYELKAILFFCLYLKTASNGKDFRKKLLSDSLHKSLVKYSSGVIVRH